MNSPLRNKTDWHASSWSALQSPDFSVFVGLIDNVKVGGNLFLPVCTPSYSSQCIFWLEPPCVLYSVLVPPTRLWRHYTCAPGKSILAMSLEGLASEGQVFYLILCFLSAILPYTQLLAESRQLRLQTKRRIASMLPMNICLGSRTEAKSDLSISQRL